MRVTLKGLNRVRKKRADGSEAIYYYAWKGGPRLPGKPKSPEFVAAYAEAHKDRKAPRTDTLSGLITLYRSKPEYLTLADSTKKEWSRWLDRIILGEEREGKPTKTGLGDLGFRTLEDARVRADLMDWRDQWADSPRAADYGVQVLSRVLGFAVDRGILSMNRATGIPHLYDVDRSDLVWEAADLAKFIAAAPPPVSHALRLACLTGLRRGDLVKLRWAQVGDLAITLTTNKSRKGGKGEGRRTATVPVLKEARALLAEIGRKDATAPVLQNAKGGAWNADSLSDRISHFATKIAVERSIHDARGTFATRLCLAGLTDEEIADIMGWERDRVRRIRARYVDSERVVRALVTKLQRNEEGAKAPNFFPTGPMDDVSAVAPADSVVETPPLTHLPFVTDHERLATRIPMETDSWSSVGHSCRLAFRLLRAAARDYPAGKGRGGGLDDAGRAVRSRVARYRMDACDDCSWPLTARQVLGQGTI